MLYMKGGIAVGNESLRTNDSVDEILETYGKMVNRLAYARTKNRYDADDVMQEVFLRYIRSDKEFADEEHRRAWLIRTTINCSKTLLTSSWFRRTSPLEDTLTTELEEKSEVYYAVMALPVKYRTVIHLYYYEDLRIDEIAKITNTNAIVTKQHLSRARKKLREILKEDFAK